MKTVFDNRMLAHVWASQSQPYGRSGSMKFDVLRVQLLKTI